VKKVLLIDDDPVARQAYRMALERAGYRVEVAEDGQQALEQLQRAVPGGILLDLIMPHLDGIEFLKAMRCMHHLAEIPVVVYTNASIPKLVTEAREAGANMVFSKADLTAHTLIRAFDSLIPVR